MSLGRPTTSSHRAPRPAPASWAKPPSLLSRRDQQAVLHTTILANTPTAATIAGTAATIEIDGPFYQPGGFTLTATDGATRLRYDEPRIAHEGLHYQAAEVARRITAGETGSPLRPLSASIDVLRVMDEVRRQTRDRYPDEDDDRQ